ncbi:MAG: polyprenyl synthetase family protein [Prevotellaceae bacterium]|jgi:octaprenyl-diphosphate synthase|nr:polyprenyl synthetase family protein [Prevotellaceae bacterium]
MIHKVKPVKDNTKNSMIPDLGRNVNTNGFMIPEVKDALKRFDVFFHECLPSDSSLLNKVLKYVFDRQGKRIRPVCVFLSAMASSKPLTDATFVGASAIEMIHTASIIHDDVVDRSDQRRGNKSVNAEWTSRIAVLTGDYLLAKALMLVTEYDMLDFMSIMSRPIVEMSEGEMIQTEKSIDLDIDENMYFEIIKKKTAALIGASMEVGAKSAKANDLSQLMHRIGENIGMAFQIKDDIFDYEKTNLLGKPTGNDVIERKITLPLIHSLKQVDEKKRTAIIRHVKNAAMEKKNVIIIRDFVMEHGGIEYAASVARDFVEQAISLISTLNDSPAKQALINFAHYVIQREN